MSGKYLMTSRQRLNDHEFIGVRFIHSSSIFRARHVQDPHFLGDILLIWQQFWQQLLLFSSPKLWKKLSETKNPSGGAPGIVAGVQAQSPILHVAPAAPHAADALGTQLARSGGAAHLLDIPRLGFGPCHYQNGSKTWQDH